MTIDQMRMAVEDAYSSDSWHKKVKNMSDNQVTAIYYKFLANGKINPKNSKSKSHKDIPVKTSEEPGQDLEGCFGEGMRGEQLSLF